MKSHIDWNFCQFPCVRHVHLNMTKSFGVRQAQNICLSYISYNVVYWAWAWSPVLLLEFIYFTCMCIVFNICRYYTSIIIMSFIRNLSYIIRFSFTFNIWLTHSVVFILVVLTICKMGWKHNICVYCSRRMSVDCKNWLCKCIFGRIPILKDYFWKIQFFFSSLS